MAVARIELAPGYGVSRLTKGNWQLAERHGPKVDPAVAIDGMRRFVEAGITNFDCADHYVGVEELIGAFRARHPDLAKRLTVQTKLVPDRDVLKGVKRADIELIVDRARRRLGQETLDMVQFHWWDWATPGHLDSLLWLRDMQREGKLKLIGVTNYDVPHLAEAIEAGVPVVSHQVQYSPLDRRPENGMVALCRRHGVHLQCYGTIAGGFLGNKWLGAPAPAEAADRSQAKYRLIIEEFGGWALYQDLMAVLGAIAKRHGVSITAVVTRWVLDRPGVATAIVGARTDAHLSDLLTVETLALDDADRAAVAAVVGRAKGPAGDCYSVERVPGGPHGSLNWMNQNLQGVGAR
ncbi:MAG: aldo/keto reductase [Rhodospirillaceae bacterium]|nr:aldo/keto reductase [Rhodospirillaceae bacterium]